MGAGTRSSFAPWLHGWLWWHLLLVCDGAGIRVTHCLLCWGPAAMLSGSAGTLCNRPPSCSPAHRYTDRCWRGCLLAAMLLSLQAGCCSRL